MKFFKNPLRSSKKQKGSKEKEKEEGTTSASTAITTGAADADADVASPTADKNPLRSSKNQKESTKSKEKKEAATRGAIITSTSAADTGSSTSSPSKPGVVDFPENYVAFVLPSDVDANQAPSANEVESWKQGTVAYIENRLRSKYPTFSHLVLDVLECQVGSKRPAPRFHVFMRVKGEAHFSGAGGNKETEPDRAEVFEQYISSFTEDYLAQAIRPLRGQCATLQYAKEVRARRLGSGAGGAVTAPRFYLAFVCKEDPVTTKPTKQQNDKLLKMAQTEFERLLREEFEDSFQTPLRLKIVGHQLNAGKPEPQYNLYIEMEAVGNFSRDVPEPMDFFRSMASPSIDFSNQIKANVFKDATRLVVRCIYVETLPEPEEPEKGPQGEQQDGGDPADGESPEGAKEEKEAAKVPTVKMELGFYVALVIKDLQGMPSVPEVFDDLCHKFFGGILKRDFPGFRRIELEPNPAFQAGIPLPRFNLLHQYNATIEWEHPPPEGDDVLKKILFCDLGQLYNQIKALPMPYNNMIEFTLRRALEKQVTDQAYGGILDDEAKRKKAAAEAEAKRKAEEAEAKRKAEAEAKRKAEEEAKRKAEAAEAKRKAEEERKRREEAKRAAAEEEKRKKEEEAAAAAAARREEERRKEEQERKEKERREAEAAKAAKAKKEAERKAKEEEEKRRRAEQEAAAKKKAEEERLEKERQAAAAAAAQAKKKKEEEEAKRKAAEAKKKKEEEAKRVAEEEKRKKAEAARRSSTGTPATKAKANKSKKVAEASVRASTGTSTPAEKPKVSGASKASKRATMPPRMEKVEGPTVTEGTSDVFAAFTIPNCREPTKDEYDAIAQKTAEYYTEHLRKAFPAAFESVQVGVSKACFGEKKPSDKFDVYLEWDIKASFVESPDAPTRHALCSSLVNIDLNTYVMKYVWALKGTPFEGVRAVFTQQVNTKS